MIRGFFVFTRVKINQTIMIPMVPRRYQGAKQNLVPEFDLSNCESSGSVNEHLDSGALHLKICHLNNGIMIQTISVKFFARKDRSTSEGLVPVFMRIGVGEKRMNVVTKVYVKLDEWSLQDGKIKTRTKDAQKINSILDGFKMKAFHYQRELMNEGKAITVDNIKAKWYGHSLERKVMVNGSFQAT